MAGADLPTGSTTGSSAGPDGRIALAESFLQEAVYRSRGDQAGATLMSQGSAGCGLGEKPSVALDLSAKGEEIYAELAPGANADLASIREVMTSWVKRQDALDRKRNHFMKDFRSAHGFDRRGYAPELLATFEEGLEAVNGEVASDRREAAASLLAIFAS